MNRTEQPLPFSLNTVGGSKHQTVLPARSIATLLLP